MKFCPPQHTGRKVEHHHTSYFGLSVLLILVGFALGASTLSATAASQEKQGAVQVTANINGPLPVAAPTILQPSRGQTLTSNPIVVSGDCLVSLIVEIRKNGYLAGSTRCNNNGSYSLKIDLLRGSNKLVARQFNGSGASPDSNVVMVTYQPNTFVAIPPQNQLIIQSQTSSQAASIGEELSWTIEILGGTPPYALAWDWGDGTVDLKSLEKAGEFTASHSYSKSGSHTVVLRVTDKNGETALLELSEYTPTSTIATGSGHDNKPGLLLTLWPLYALLIVIVATFYIGEKFGEIHERKIQHLLH